MTDEPIEMTLAEYAKLVGKEAAIEFAVEKLGYSRDMAVMEIMVGSGEIPGDDIPEGYE